MKYVILVLIKTHVLDYTLWTQSFSYTHNHYLRKKQTHTHSHKIKDDDPLTRRSCLDKDDVCAMFIEHFEVKNG